MRTVPVKIYTHRYTPVDTPPDATFFTAVTTQRARAHAVYSEVFREFQARIVVDIYPGNGETRSDAGGYCFDNRIFGIVCFTSEIILNN